MTDCGGMLTYQCVQCIIIGIHCFLIISNIKVFFFNIDQLSKTENDMKHTSTFSLKYLLEKSSKILKVKLKSDTYIHGSSKC